MTYRYEVHDDTQSITIHDNSGDQVAELFRSDDFDDDKRDAEELVNHLNDPKPGNDGYRVEQTGFGYLSEDDDEAVAVEGSTPVNLMSDDGSIVAMLTSFDDGVALTEVLNQSLH